jgi:hypothetical protein
MSLIYHIRSKPIIYQQLSIRIEDEKQLMCNYDAVKVGGAPDK